jgi:hypothetical protein
VGSRQPGAVIAGWACSNKLNELAGAALDSPARDDDPAVLAQGAIEAAMGEAVAGILRPYGFTVSPRTEVPGSHQFIVRKGPA